jgi:hypothetical protein
MALVLLFAAIASAAASVAGTSSTLPVLVRKLTYTHMCEPPHRTMLGRAALQFR